MIKKVYLLSKRTELYNYKEKIGIFPTIESAKKQSEKIEKKLNEITSTWEMCRKTPEYDEDDEPMYNLAEKSFAYLTDGGCPWHYNNVDEVIRHFKGHYTVEELDFYE